MTPKNYPDRVGLAPHICTWTSSQLGDVGLNWACNIAPHIIPDVFVWSGTVQSTTLDLGLVRGLSPMLVSSSPSTHHILFMKVPNDTHNQEPTTPKHWVDRMGSSLHTCIWISPQSGNVGLNWACNTIPLFFFFLSSLNQNL